jgi:hypothetical protein
MDNQNLFTTIKQKEVGAPDSDPFQKMKNRNNLLHPVGSQLVYKSGIWSCGKENRIRIVRPAKAPFLARSFFWIGEGKMLRGWGIV